MGWVSGKYRGIEFDREMAQAALEMYEGAPTHLPVAWDVLEEFKEWIAAGRPDADVTRANFEAELEAEKVARKKKATRKKGSAPGRVTVGTEGIIRHSRYNQLGRSFAEQVDGFKAGLIPQGEDLIVWECMPRFASTSSAANSS